jgi:hypothetical protein
MCGIVVIQIIDLDPAILLYCSGERMFIVAKNRGNRLVSQSVFDLNLRVFLKEACKSARH